MILNLGETFGIAGKVRILKEIKILFCIFIILADRRSVVLVRLKILKKLKYLYYLGHFWLKIKKKMNMILFLYYLGHL